MYATQTQQCIKLCEKYYIIVHWWHTNNSQHLCNTVGISHTDHVLHVPRNKKCAKIPAIFMRYLWESCRHKLTVSTDQYMVHTRWRAPLHRTHERPAPVLAHTTVCQSVSKRRLSQNKSAFTAGLTRSMHNCPLDAMKLTARTTQENQRQQMTVKEMRLGRRSSSNSESPSTRQVSYRAENLLLHSIFKAELQL